MRLPRSVCFLCLSLCVSAADGQAPQLPLQVPKAASSLQIFPCIGGLNMLRRRLRLITRIKFALVTLSCVYLGWFLLYFHLIASATH